MANYQGGRHTIGGKHYITAYDGLPTMSAAQVSARAIRAGGYNARIISRRLGRHLLFDVLMSEAKSKRGK